MDLKRLNTETLSAQLNQLLPQLRWQIGRLGVPGKIGIGFLVVSAIYFFSAVAPQETALQQLRKALKRCRSRLKNHPLAMPMRAKK
jgi:hypothetical protein